MNDGGSNAAAGRGAVVVGNPVLIAKNRGGRADDGSGDDGEGLEMLLLGGGGGGTSDRLVSDDVTVLVDRHCAGCGDTLRRVENRWVDAEHAGVAPVTTLRDEVQQQRQLRAPDVSRSGDDVAIVAVPVSAGASATGIAATTAMVKVVAGDANKAAVPGGRGVEPTAAAAASCSSVGVVTVLVACRDPRGAEACDAPRPVETMAGSAHASQPGTAPSVRGRVSVVSRGPVGRLSVVMRALDDAWHGSQEEDAADDLAWERLRVRLLRVLRSRRRRRAAAAGAEC